MNTRLLKLVRGHRGEFNAGKFRAGRLHICEPAREVIRQCRQSVAERHRRNPAMRAARKAYYLGAFCALRAERRLCRTFRL